MMLSDEQMNVISGSRNGAWVDIPLPTGRQQLPDWVRGAHVDWHDGVANAPTIKLNVRGKVNDWDGKVWMREKGGMYMARHPDGRLQQHHHSGAVSMTAMRRFRTTDGKLHDYVPQKPGISNVFTSTEDYESSFEPGEWVEVEVLATTKQDGYGGANIWLDMDDGTQLVLRGPWHVGAPPGYVEVTCCDSSQRYEWERKKEHKPWYRRFIGGSMYLRHDVFLAIVATYLPHVRIAGVEKSYGYRLEAYRAEWGMLKAEVYDLEINRYRNKEPAGPFWRTYWDGTNAYCGNLRVPEYGYRDEVHEGDKPKQAEIDRAEERRKRRGY
jgi:hypothetical protein